VRRKAAPEMAEADVLIAPAVSVSSMSAQNEQERAIQAGYKAARVALPRIRAEAERLRFLDQTRTSEAAAQVDLRRGLSGLIMSNPERPRAGCHIAYLSVCSGTPANWSRRKRPVRMHCARPTSASTLLNVRFGARWTTGVGSGTVLQFTATTGGSMIDTGP